MLPTPAHRMLGGQLISTLHEVAQAQRKVDSLTGELAAAQQALADLTAAQADLEDLLDTLDARQA